MILTTHSTMSGIFDQMDDMSYELHRHGTGVRRRQR